MNPNDDLLFNKRLIQKKTLKKQHDDISEKIRLHHDAIMTITSNLLSQKKFEIPEINFSTSFQSTVSNELLESFHIYIRNCIESIEIRHSVDEIENIGQEIEQDEEDEDEEETFFRHEQEEQDQVIEEEDEDEDEEPDFFVRFYEKEQEKQKEMTPPVKISKLT